MSLVEDAQQGKQPRLYMIDYWSLSEGWKLAQEDGKMAKQLLEGPVQHAGRALLYLHK